MDDIQQLSEEALWARLAEVTGRDRIDVLFELGTRALRREDFATATSMWQEAETAAGDLGDVEIAAEAVGLQGRAAFHSGEYDSAILLYQRAVEGHERAGRSRDAAGALWCLADSFRVVGEHEQQLAAARDSRRLAEQEGADSLAGDACLMQAKALYYLDRDREALDAAAAARAHYRTAARPDRVAQVDDFTMDVHLYLGNLDEALDLARGCLVLARMSSSESDDRYARYRLAEVLLRRGETEAALAQADTALQAYRAHDDLAGVATCEWLRGRAFFDRDEPEASLAAFGDARVLFDATGYDYEALRCETRMAMVRHYMGDFEQAARMNRRLIEAYRICDQMDGSRWSIVRLLENLHEDGRHDQCRAAAESHLEQWPEGITAADPAYREFLGLYALAMERCGQAEQAAAIANHVIANTPGREASAGTAYCYEVRGRSRLDDDEVGASQDFSHAVALLLAAGKVERARELSKYFLPADGEAAARGSAGMRQEEGPSGTGAGHG